MSRSPDAWLLSLVATFALSSCIAGGLPPTRGEISPALLRTKSGLETGVRATAAVSLASGTTDPDQSFDVAVGYVYENVEPSNRDLTDEGKNDERLGGARTLNGFFVEYSQRLSRARSQNGRTWLGLRGGYNASSQGDGGNSFDALGRVTWEAFTPAVGEDTFDSDCGGGWGAAHGTMGMGVYLEAGGRVYSEGERALVAGLGLEVRIPAFFGMVFDLCPDHW
jgi:hypothetical protein